MKANLTAFLLLLFAGVPSARADVRLSPVFSSNMVLQRDVPAKISGWAAPGETVVVKLGGKVIGHASGAGAVTPWTVTLPVLSAGPVPDLTVEGNNTITLTNLLAGDVWICSGQSNMEMTLQSGPWCTYGGVRNATEEVAAANHPQIRLFAMLSKQPWAVCAPESAQSFSAAAYFFGRELAQRLQVPIGLVQAAVGGTAAEYWTPRSVREQWPGFPSALENARRFEREQKPVIEAYEQWQKQVTEARRNGQPVPARPPEMTTALYAKFSAARATAGTGKLYESRIQPLTTMTIKGAIWYQGEGNVDRAAEYADLLTQLIGGWRQAWGQGEFPFLIQQLVNFNGGPATWPELRAAQQKVVESVPRTGLAVGIDIGDPDNIHPANKQEVGRRLALVALREVYGRAVVAAGPRPLESRFEANHVVLTFDPGDQQPGLVLQAGADTSFEVAGSDGKFEPATVEVRATTLTLRTAKVREPRAVRYAWHGNPTATLFNRAGLPAAPFRMNAQNAPPDEK